MARSLAVLLATALAALLCVPPGPAAAGAGTDPVGHWPLLPEPEVVATFDPPADPWGSGHRGVDLLGRPGQTVLAALPGRVAFAGTLAGRGVLVIDHGATRTTYEPVAATVSVGDTVNAGAPVGRLQSGTSHCAPRTCLHWGWIEGADTYLDPLRLVGGGPVRLLPLWRDRPVDAAPVPQRSAYDGWREGRVSGPHIGGRASRPAEERSRNRRVETHPALANRLPGTISGSTDTIARSAVGRFLAQARGWACW